MPFIADVMLDVVRLSVRTYFLSGTGRERTVVVRLYIYEYRSEVTALLVLQYQHMDGREKQGSESIKKIISHAAVLYIWWTEWKE